MPMIEHLDFWHWWVIGIVLFIIEILVPGAFIMWLGIGAIGVGLIEGLASWFGISLSFGTQGITFAILSMIATFVGKKFYINKAKSDVHNNLNRRGEQYVGRTLTLLADITDNRGHVRIDDTQWIVQGNNYLAGTIVKVVAVKGALLIVEGVTSVN